MTGLTTGEESFIAKNMDANIYAPSAAGVGTPSGNYFAGMTQGGGEGLNASLGGKIGSSMQNVSIDQTINSAGNLDNVLGSFQGDAMSSNPFSVADGFMPIKNLGATGLAIHKTGNGLSGLAELRPFAGAVNAGLQGHTSVVSPSKGGGMQAG